jgi:hypothetical protein
VFGFTTPNWSDLNAIMGLTIFLTALHAFALAGTAGADSSAKHLPHSVAIENGFIEWRNTPR